MAELAIYHQQRHHIMPLKMTDWCRCCTWSPVTDMSRGPPPCLVMQSGIVTSDLLITVSQGYAAEIINKRQEARVDMLLAKRAPKLRGIVNGIDVSEWDPATDKHLAARYVQILLNTWR